LITDPRGAKRVDDSDHIEATQRCAWKLRAQRCCTCGFIISSRTPYRGACHQKYWMPDLQLVVFARPLNHRDRGEGEAARLAAA
jgi:hypothetical protein